MVLKYCHEIGVTHRDIKSDNILLDDCNNLMLIDFAFSLSSLSGKKVENFSGTPSYMSPELVQKQPHCPKKADVWALGIIAYKILTGLHPFSRNIGITQATKEEPDFSMHLRILHKDFHKEPIAHFPLTLRNFFGRTLEKVPEKRPTIKELLLDSWIKTNSPNIS